VHKVGNKIEGHQFLLYRRLGASWGQSGCSGDGKISCSC